MIVNSRQTSLFDTEEAMIDETSEWGTFKDSLKAPVHGWFTYPAGFSYKAVENSLEKAGLKKGVSTIYDPFMGSGTTNLVARSMGYNSVGVEAHPFVYPITKTKMNWDVNQEEIYNQLELIGKELKVFSKPKNVEVFLASIFPDLIIKCFLPETLLELWLIRESIKSLNADDSIKDFLNTGLICVLREVSTAATGWPYIAPNKMKITSMSKNGFGTYSKRIKKMILDISDINRKAARVPTHHDILYGDSRDTSGQIVSESIDHIFTSPPYLNNFDYADRTRLEMYFMGAATKWSDITDKVRKKLMTSATTQIARTDKKYQFLDEFKSVCDKEYEFLVDAVDQLSVLRNIKGGKKSYDLMTVGYFNDIYHILKDNFRVLKDDTQAHYILGDSAPYGVHIPTDELIGKIGLNLGFKSYKLKVLRIRGNKWQNNPQRHGVLLQESVVTLYK